MKEKLQKIQFKKFFQKFQYGIILKDIIILYASIWVMLFFSCGIDMKYNQLNKFPLTNEQLLNGSITLFFLFFIAWLALQIIIGSFTDQFRYIKPKYRSVLIQTNALSELLEHIIQNNDEREQPSQIFTEKDFNEISLAEFIEELKNAPNDEYVKYYEYIESSK